jgi:LuxR family maltose regulon positive regulatory protein
MTAAEQKLLGEDAGYTKYKLAELLAVQAIGLALDDDTLSASAAADQSLRYDGAGKFSRLAELVARFAAWKAGAAPASGDAKTVQALETAGAGRPALPSAILADVLDLTLAAAIEFSALGVESAERLARCALLRAGDATAMRASPAATLGLILYEQGSVQASETLLRTHLDAIRSCGGVDCVAHTYTILARTAASRGDRAAALAALSEGRDIAEARGWPRLLAVMLAERIRLCGPSDAQRADGLVMQLANLAARHRPQTQCARSEITVHLAMALVYGYLNLGATTGQRPPLAQLRHEVWLSQDLRAFAWVSLAEAQVLWQEGAEKEGLIRLTEALRVAATTGLRQQLLDAGPLVPVMIERLLQSGGLDPDLLAFTICISESLQRAVTACPQRARRTSRDDESLTARECAVLRLIGEGRTNKAIAQAQGIAPETVKTHIKHIFLKLGVERRAQAVSKAERLGLLAS